MNRKFTILYDGECGICSASAKLIESKDKKSLFEIIPYQNVNFQNFSNGLSRDLAEKSVILIDNESNNYFIASRAVFEIAKNLGGIYKLIGIIGANSFISSILNPIYYLIARQRRQISICLGLNACSVNYDKATT
ncbi:MAG: DUF393 domain-containing protein [Candidatus Kapabacteria bacterium]|nr:DUF393 domain-containing protein [Candidatus Kapabacteria bacterium]